MQKDYIVSLIILTRNDADIILSRLLKIKRALLQLDCHFEIVIIDNNSADETIEEITSLKTVIRHTRILRLSKTYDDEVALTAGLDNCVGDYAIIFSLYLDPIEILPELIAKLKSGSNLVIGKMKKNPVKLYGPSKLIVSIAEKFSTTGWIYRSNYTLALDRKALNSVIRTRRKSRNFSYINSLIGLKKSTLRYMPITKYKNLIRREDFFSLITTILNTAISNSFKPIRYLSLIGMLFSFLYILYVIIILILYFFFDQKQLIPKGWVTISVVLGSMFFLLFSTLSVISEYVIRTLIETRQEPFYFISEEINKTEILPKKKRLNII